MPQQKLPVTVVRRCPNNSRVKLSDGTTRVVPTVNLLDYCQTTKTAHIVESHTNQLTLAKKFQLLNNMIDTVITGSAKSLFLFGSSGVGKSHEVLAYLKSKSLLQFDENHPRRHNTYTLIKGRTTAYGLYRVLYEHKEDIIIVDDSDDFLSNETSTSILKAALDSYSERIISWEAKTSPGADSLPRSFIFNGKVIFISNKSRTQLDPAIQSRCLTFELTLTKDQISKKMSQILPSLDSTLSNSEKHAVLKYLRDNSSTIHNYNLRTLINALRLRETNKYSWKELLLCQ